MERRIDIQTWARRDIFAFFSGMSNPFYAVSFRQDVTRLYDYCKQNGISFYYALIFLCTGAINQVPAFRYAIRGPVVYELPNRLPSFTDLHRGCDLFHIVTMPCEGSVIDFCRAAREKSRAQTAFIDMSAETDALIYFSCLPWLDMTAMTNERDLSSPEARDDSVPRIAWGQYRREGDRLALGMSVEVNHRLIDGLHIGQFAQALTRSIEALT